MNNQAGAGSATCGKSVIHLIAREGSFFPCALEKGHEGGCRAAGNCFKHGRYFGDAGTAPQCPHWPTCAHPSSPPQVQESLSNEERVLARYPNAYCDRIVGSKVIFVIIDGKGPSLSADCDSPQMAWADAAYKIE